MRPRVLTPLMFSTRQIAERLSLSDRQVKRIIASGDLRAYRIGRSVRIADEDLAAFLARRRN